MLKRENESVKKIDKLILDMLKEKMKIKQERVSIMQDAEMKKVIKKINEKMEVICLLFHEDFSIIERNIEERMKIEKTDLNFYDKIANNIIFKKLDNTLKEIEGQEHQNSQVIPVCLDRKLFIEKVLTQNIPLSFIKKQIQKKKTVDEKYNFLEK